MSFFIPYLLFASLSLTVISGIAALGGRAMIFHKLSQIFLALSGLLGMAASVAVFLSPEIGMRVSIASAKFSPVFGLDLFGAVFFFLVSLVSVLCAVYAVPYLRSYRTTYHLPSLNALVAAFVLGMQIVIVSTGPFPFMIGWEIMSLASFFLVVSDRSAESVRAALLYLVMTHLGAAAILAAFLLLAQGSFFADFSLLTNLAGTAPAWVLPVSFGLFLFGFGSKSGLVPFHVWLPEAHPAAPSHVSALMSGVMLKIAIYGFLRVTLFLLPPIGTTASLVILGFGLLTALYGVLYAALDRDFKRTLAFSSIENIGLIFTIIGISFFAASRGLEVLFEVVFSAAVFFTIAHALFKSGLFLISGVVVRAFHSRSLEKMGGLSKRLPVFSAFFCILALAAASLPPFGPFFGEWMFFQSLLGHFSLHDPFVNAILLLTFAISALVGGLAIFAMVKLFALSMLAESRSPENALEHCERPAWGEMFSIGVFTLSVLLLGPFAPAVMALIRGEAAVPSLWLLSVGSAAIQPSVLLLFLFACVLAVWILRRLMSRVEHERAYHRWDCGAPVNASMEYTATAFSAPIRFFFRLILRTKKSVDVLPVLATNPWIASKSFNMNLRSIWMDFGYLPLGRFFIGLSLQVKKIQSGNIRFYLFLIFAALILTLRIAL